MQALSSASSSGVLLTSDTSIGTVCGWIEDTRFPSAGDTSTTVLDLRGQQLGGTIPTELGLLVKVSRLDFTECLLSGSVPTELGALVELAAAFILGKNELSSSMPTELGKLRKLTKDFQLYSNRRLCGSIPTEIQALSSSAALGWRLVSGTSIGTTCGLPNDDGDDNGSEDDGDGRSHSGGQSIAAASYLTVAVASVLALAMMCTVLARLCFPRINADYYYQQVFGRYQPSMDEWESSSGPLSGNGYMELPSSQWDDTLVLHEDSYGKDGDSLFESWENSRWLIAIFDQNLKVVLWSKGLEQACAFAPGVGADLASFPFASPQQQAKMIRALSELHDAAAVPMFPDRAMHAAMLAEPNVFMHLDPALGGTGPFRSLAISMTAVLIYPLNRGGAPRPSQDVSHVLVMGQDQVDPALTSLWVGSDVTSELTSETGSASGRITAEKTGQPTSSEVIGDGGEVSGDGDAEAVAAGQMASISSSSSEGPGAGGGYTDVVGNSAPSPVTTLNQISFETGTPNQRAAASESDRWTMASLGAIREERGGEEILRERSRSSRMSIQSDTLQMAYSLFRSNDNRVPLDSMTTFGRAGNAVRDLLGGNSLESDSAGSLAEDGTVDSRSNGRVSSAYPDGTSSSTGSDLTGSGGESTASSWTWWASQSYLGPGLTGGVASESGTFNGSQGHSVEAMDERTVGVGRRHRDARSITTQSVASGGEISGLSSGKLCS